MSKKHTMKKAAAIFLGLALTVGATGCDFIVTDTQADLAQIVATVDITDNLAADDEYRTYAADVEKLIDEGGLSTEIPKRDLVAYFLNVGYTYVNSYGYTYADTINMLMEGLVSNKILTQYAVAYFLKTSEGLTAQGCLDYVNLQTEAESNETKKVLLKAHPEVLTMKYFLTENNTDPEDYNKAVYSLQSSLNSSLDSAEANYIKETTETHTHDETRTTPTNVNTENSDYYPVKADGALDYDIYTGRNTLDSCGTYEAVDGSNASTRKKAYNMFLSNLEGYGLIKEGEDTAFVTELDYYYVELSNTLGQALVTKFTDELQEAAIETLKADIDEDGNGYDYVVAKYEEILKAQQLSYTKDPSAFETAIDGLSDTSFVLYGQEGFGFVYNILIPFSASQQQAYSAAQNKNLSEEALFNARKDILANVEAKDLRGAWFCDDTKADDHYAYGKDGKYYFFENNIVNSGEGKKYEKLTQYAGNYPYNGTATYTDGEWELIPNKLKVVTDGTDGFMDEFKNYVATYAQTTVTGAPLTATYGKNYYKTGTKDVDYNAFIYYEGQVDVGGANNADFFKEGTTAYKALSAVNELMFAYSTDTGCLNTYMGYAVSPYKTDFVPEFEYAAQKVVSQGVGSYNVVATDYGWHIVYCSFTYAADGDVYGGFKVADVEAEGTFSYMFYESLKSTTATNFATDKQNKVLNGYNGSATYYTSRYQDLLDLDS